MILKETGEVIDIKLIDGPKPEFEGEKAEQYEIIEAPDGIMIGMVRGGVRYQVAGFGFAEDVDVQRYGLVDEERAPAEHLEGDGNNKPATKQAGK